MMLPFLVVSMFVAGAYMADRQALQQTQALRRSIAAARIKRSK